jgi:predicted acetyltransferase
VSVQATHRRRGLLSRLMSRQLTELHEGGEAVAALWASEPAIYGRFGYGLASRSLSVTLRRGDALRQGLPAADGSVREPAPADARAELARIWDRAFRARPGEHARSDVWWDHVLFDPERGRRGYTALRCSLVDGGYALYSTKGAWDDRGPAGEVRVRELVAVDAGRRLRLWAHLLGLDLAAEWRVGRLPLDDPLLGAVVDVRRLVPRVQDGLHVRVVRVADALQARSYGSEVDVVIEVADSRLPANTGRWRLAAGPGGATCTATGDPADLALGIEELGAVYLGGTTLVSLAAAGRVDERRSGAVAAASRAFRGDVEPVCSHVF